MKTMECAICGRKILRKKAKRRFCIECLERRQVRNLKHNKYITREVLRMAGKARA